VIACRYAVEGAGYAPVGNREILVAEGRIAVLRDGAGGRLLALPAPANAHDHARAVRTSAFGAMGRPLEAWLHMQALMPSVDPYLAAAASFGRSALGGAGSVMVHYTRAMGFSPLPEEAASVARAAADVGVRIGFAVAMRDRNALSYGRDEAVLAALPEPARAAIAAKFIRPAVPVAEQIALVAAVAAAAEGPLVNVQYGPVGVQWCSEPLLEAVAEASAASGRRVHMHLLETRYQREWADREYPGGIVKRLGELGLLSPRLTLAHCTWARPEELEAIAASGAVISVNTGSNFSLRSGIAPMAEMVRRGCRVAIGLDGATLDEDDDWLSELRLAHVLHRGWGFERAVGDAALLRAAFANGRFSVTGAEGGVIEPGAEADLLLLDWERLDEDLLGTDLPPVTLLLARARARHIHALIVAGRSVVREGVVLGIDHSAVTEELRGQLRAGLRGQDALREALGHLECVLSREYGGPAWCC